MVSLRKEKQNEIRNTWNICFSYHHFFTFFIPSDPNQDYQSDKKLHTVTALISDVANLQRHEQPIVTENKFILTNEDLKKKLIVSCSMLFNNCNNFQKGNLITIQYIRSCSLIYCQNYAYEIKSKDQYLSEKYFYTSYEKQKTEINSFLFYYLILNFILLLGTIVKPSILQYNKFDYFK